MKKQQKLWSKDFTLMVIGQIISLVGNVTLRFALSLFILDRTGSATIFGGILALTMIPTILFSPFGGVLADRASRKWIMVILDFFTAGIILSFSFLIQSDSIIPILAVTMILLSLIQCFYQPSVQASIPILVGSENLMQGNSIVVQVNAVANLVGPIAGGFLYGMLGILPILYISTACFAFSALMELFIRIPFTPIKSSVNVVKTIFADLKVGFSFVLLEKKILLKALLSLAALNFSVSCFMIVGLPYIVKMFLNLSDQYYGFLQSAMGIGMIIGGMLVGIFGKKLKPQQFFWFLISGVILLIPIAFVTINNQSPIFSYAVIITATLACMSLIAVYNICTQTLLQQMTPTHLMGKVSAFVSTLVMCATPLGQALFGALFDAFSNHIPWIVVITIIAGLIISLLSKRIFDWFRNHSTDEFRKNAEEKFLAKEYHE